MASVFTFDPDPPRVSSPWLKLTASTTHLDVNVVPVRLEELQKPALLADCGLEKLEAEPQEGPTEYKLHLLLRPRRSFSATSTVKNVSGSYSSKPRSVRTDSTLPTRADRSSPIPAPTRQSRQNRLQHLTTQLLWRLQQSSPYHSSATSDLVLPVLPEATPRLEAPSQPGKLLPGLEESRGALYEIGVSDDGTFVGLTQDEMEESLVNLRAMSASLGCRVDIVRTVIVGDCQWTDDAVATGLNIAKHRIENLFVTEALVIPDIQQSHPDRDGRQLSLGAPAHEHPHQQKPHTELVESPAAQLRVTLTGSTTSGKSSLLGTLSTSTLDNGRGKSRLSLLKHRHEIASGVTSSVAPELIGYCETPTGSKSGAHIINYGSGNVSSWNEIHSSAEGGRVVFLIDSAGHPRYRRTAVRGLISWAPHWTICCVAADDDEDTTGKVGATASAREIFGSEVANVDLSRAHLNICLKLDLALVVVITKLDLASKAGLRRTLAKVLSILKSAGRQPLIIPSSPTSSHALGPQRTSRKEDDEVRSLLAPLKDHDRKLLVPIVLTSAVTGAGISNVHAILHNLPIPPSAGRPVAKRSQEDPSVSVLFHIDEIFTVPYRSMPSSHKGPRQSSETVPVLSGHLRYGAINIGDHLILGPGHAGPASEAIDRFESDRIESLSRVSGPMSSSPGLESTPSRSHSRIAEASVETQLPSSQWERVLVVSLRNLRLPVRTLSAGQVGTVGISFSHPKSKGLGHAAAPSQDFKARKGMVLLRAIDEIEDRSPSAYRGFSARFSIADFLELGPGAMVFAYIASIRAMAKIVSFEAVEGGDGQAILMPSACLSGGDDQDHFSFEKNHASEDNEIGIGIGIGSSSGRGRGGGCERYDYDENVKYTRNEVTFQFLTQREWIEVGTQVLVMPAQAGGPSIAASGGGGGGEPDGVGFEGFVGRISRAVA
ncbi:hypothetical protein MMC09_001592 [Bachmanniomyces sp. S44760]|nr:hypothetical protein [Bachmanniomyces sp. S44760]